MEVGGWVGPGLTRIFFLKIIPKYLLSSTDNSDVGVVYHTLCIIDKLLVIMI